MTDEIKKGGFTMGILLWIVLGAIAGFIAGAIMGGGKRGFIMNVVVGILGANIGGFIADKVFHMQGVTGFNLYSILVAVGGACVLLLVVRLFAGKNS